MRAVVFSLKPLRAATGKLLGPLSSWFTLGPLAPTKLTDIPEPDLPNEHWVKLDVIQCGICGADVATIMMKRRSRSFLSAFASFPMGLGHEIVARVAEVGAGVTRLAVGDRVVVEPFLPCATRGIEPPCKACARGNYTACEYLAEGGVIPHGANIGNNSFTGGGFGERLVAHEQSCTPVPDELSDDAAVLIEPFGCALHAVNRRVPADDETALVIGAGTMGLCSMLAMRALGSKAKILCLVRHRYQEALAKKVGADVVIRKRGAALFDAMTAETGATVYRSRFGGGRVMRGGVDLVIDTVGSPESLTNAVALVRGRGTVILLGMGEARGFDPTGVWFKELTVLGSMGHGIETHADERVGGFDLALRLATEQKLDLADLVTHRFGLEDWSDAVRTCLNRKRTHAVKVVLKP